MRPIYIRRSSERPAPPPRGPEAGTGRRLVVSRAGTVTAGLRVCSAHRLPVPRSCGPADRPWDYRVRNRAVIRLAPVCGKQQCLSVRNAGCAFVPAPARIIYGCSVCQTFGSHLPPCSQRPGSAPAWPGLSNSSSVCKARSWTAKFCCRQVSLDFPKLACSILFRNSFVWYSAIKALL